MSDLISRSRAIENIWDVFNSYANDSQRFDEYETEAINNAFKVLQKTIESQPTAYDPDKVVETMDEALIEFNDGISCTECVFKDVCDDGYEGCTETMVAVCKGIARKGGVE